MEIDKTTKHIDLHEKAQRMIYKIAFRMKNTQTTTGRRAGFNQKLPSVNHYFNSVMLCSIPDDKITFEIFVTELFVRLERPWDNEIPEDHTQIQRSNRSGG